MNADAHIFDAIIFMVVTVVLASLALAAMLFLVDRQARRGLEKAAKDLGLERVQSTEDTSSKDSSPFSGQVAGVRIHVALNWQKATLPGTNNLPLVVEPLVGTLIVAQYQSPFPFRFNVHRGRAPRWWPFHTGDRSFDRRCTVGTDKPEVVTELLAPAALRKEIQTFLNPSVWNARECAITAQAVILRTSHRNAKRIVRAIQEAASLAAHIDQARVTS